MITITMSPETLMNIVIAIANIVKNSGTHTGSTEARYNINKTPL